MRGGFQNIGKRPIAGYDNIRGSANSYFLQHRLQVGACVFDIGLCRNDYFNVHLGTEPGVAALEEIREDHHQSAVALETTPLNRLNTRNPFTGRPIPEPGRVFFMDLQVTF